MASRRPCNGLPLRVQTSSSSSSSPSPASFAFQFDLWFLLAIDDSIESIASSSATTTTEYIVRTSSGSMNSRRLRLPIFANLEQQQPQQQQPVGTRGASEHHHQPQRDHTFLSSLKPAPIHRSIPAHECTMFAPICVFPPHFVCSFLFRFLSVVLYALFVPYLCLFPFSLVWFCPCCSALPLVVVVVYVSCLLLLYFYSSLLVLASYFFVRVCVLCFMLRVALVHPRFDDVVSLLVVVCTLTRLLCVLIVSRCFGTHLVE